MMSACGGGWVGAGRAQRPAPLSVLGSPHPTSPASGRKRERGLFAYRSELVDAVLEANSPERQFAAKKCTRLLAVKLRRRQTRPSRGRVEANRPPCYCANHIMSFLG